VDAAKRHVLAAAHLKKAFRFIILLYMKQKNKSISFQEIDAKIREASKGVSLVSDKIKGLERKQFAYANAKTASAERLKRIESEMSESKKALEELTLALGKHKKEKESLSRAKKPWKPTLKIGFSPKEWVKANPGHSYGEYAETLLAFMAEIAETAKEMKAKQAAQGKSARKDTIDPPRESRRGITVSEGKKLMITQTDERGKKRFLNMKNGYSSFIEWMIYNDPNKIKAAWEEGCKRDNAVPLIRGVPLWSKERDPAPRLNRYLVKWPKPGLWQGIWFVRGLETSAFTNPNGDVARLINYAGLSGKVEMRELSAEEAQKYQDEIDSVR
jgi:hypothetical protein